MPRLDPIPDTPGFGDPVADAQTVFRLVLDAMAHPGHICELPAALLPDNRSALSDAGAALALTLLDFETPTWLDTSRQDAAAFLRFHCSAPIVADPRDSRFAFAGDVAGLPPQTAFDLGSDDFPDRSTTLVIDVPGLAQDTGLILRGPGIRDQAHLCIDGLPAQFWRERAELAASFPLGLDLIFACGRSFAALPRTTIVERN